ncbi:MAG: TetR family transcriptional regulator [Frankiales bacterium]|nr:TetR family transcriptional regulator [Frankiales bacterium]
MLIALTSVLLAALTAGAWWAYQRSIEGQVTSDLVGYKVVDDRTVTVTFEVHKDAQQRVRCRLEALGDDGGAVGTQDVHLGPDADSRVTTTITTTALAYAGVVRGCRAEDP